MTFHCLRGSRVLHLCALVLTLVVAPGIDHAAAAASGAGLRPALAPLAARLQPICFGPEEALSHLGQQGCVEGAVTNTTYAQRSNGRPTFLDFGDSFTAVVWGEDRPKFDPPPERLRGRRIRVTGQITSYRGKAEIVVRDPSQLLPIDIAAPAATATLSPSPTPSPMPPTPTTAVATPAIVASPAATATAPSSPTRPASPTVTGRTATIGAGTPRPTSTPPPPDPAPEQTVGGGASRSLMVAAAGLIVIGAAGAAWYGLRRR